MAKATNQKGPFGEELFKQRGSRGWTQKDLADQLNTVVGTRHDIMYDYTALSKWETGKRIPPSSVADHLDSIFGTIDTFAKLRSAATATSTLLSSAFVVRMHMFYPAMLKCDLTSPNDSPIPSDRFKTVAPAYSRNVGQDRTLYFFPFTVIR
jgi:transcriptional regulator with XRE-family HTH domain